MHLSKRAGFVAAVVILLVLIVPAVAFADNTVYTKSATITNQGNNDLTVKMHFCRNTVNGTPVLNHIWYTAQFSGGHAGVTIRLDPYQQFLGNDAVFTVDSTTWRLFFESMYWSTR